MQRRNTETDNEGPGVARLQKNLGAHRATAQRFSSWMKSDSAFGGSEKESSDWCGTMGWVHTPRVMPGRGATDSP